MLTLPTPPVIDDRLALLLQAVGLILCLTVYIKQKGRPASQRNKILSIFAGLVSFFLVLAVLSNGYAFQLFLIAAPKVHAGYLIWSALPSNIQMYIAIFGAIIALVLVLNGFRKGRAVAPAVK